MDEIKVVTIDDREYYVLQEVMGPDHKTYLFLSNTMEEDDMLIRKVEENQLVPLADEEEFEDACNLLLSCFIGNEEY